jgi:predicted ester cyclase
MPVEINSAKSTVLRYFEEVWNQRKLQTAKELLADSFIGHERNADDAIGANGLQSVASAFFQNFPDATFSVIQAIGEDDTVALHLRFEAVHRQTGRPVKVSGMIFIQLNEGNIVESWSNWDEYGMFQQIGGKLVFDE